MHNSPTVQIRALLLGVALILITGCDGASLQTLEPLTVAATPLSISTTRAANIKTVAHLREGTAKDLTGHTQSTRSIFVPSTGRPAATIPSEARSGSTQVTIAGAAVPNSLTPTFTAWGAPVAMTTGTTTASSETAFATDTQNLLLGNKVTDTNGETSANYFNSLYAVTGSNVAGYTVASGTMCFAPGTVTNGKSTDIGIVPAASSTTEATSALCSATYTHTSSTSPGCVTVSLAGCGTLKPNTAYWIFSITNDPISGSPYYFTNCGGGCTSTVPTSNVGNYHSFYVGRTYGAPYTNLPANFTGPNTYQVSNYVSLSPVTQAVTPVVTWATPVPVASGTVLSATQLNAKANVPGSFVYSPAAGVVLAAGTQPLKAVFLPADTTNYSSTTAFTSLHVNPSSVPAGGVPTITWNTPAAITYGTVLSNTELNATANVPGSFVYTPAAGTVLRAGLRWQTLSVTFTPADTKYSMALASVHLIVNQATPTIAWPAPVPIASGTHLGATQFNATASVPGTFLYSPPVGTVLSTGTQQLTAVFSPTDTTDYSSATAHNSLVVSSPSSGPTGNPVSPPPTPSPQDPNGGCRLAAGASTSAIQTAINTAANNSCAAPSTGTVLFAAGNYTISSQISIPCPTAAMVIQGTTPPGVGTTWPITPTVILTSTLTNSAAFYGTACNTAITFQYLQFNGGNPSGGGGGFLYAPPGMNNLTLTYNWFYGNSAIQPTTQQADSFIWLDGSSVVGSTRTTNTNITWNRFGKAGSADCANLMNVLGGNNSCDSTGYNPGGTNVCWYQNGQSEKDDGGYCAAVGIHVNVDNLTISNNSVQTQEQGFKFFEGCGNFPCPDVFKPTNVTVANNDLAGIHRIALEAQMGGPGPWNITNNSLHDEILFGGVSWGWSVPQNGDASFQNANTQNVTNNLLIENTPKGVDKSGNAAARSYGVEYWSTAGTASNNLIQGLWGGGVAWGFGGPSWSINNNTFQQLSTYFENYISQEESQTSGPSQSGNAMSETVSPASSAAPSISPSGGSQTFPLTVTLTDSGNTSGPGPLGNTGIWYTTDGSTPVPGTGTAKYLASGGSFTLSSAATVKAVGMWGALNQPTSYPAGYGFVPSAVVSASYVTASIAKPAATARISSSEVQASAATATASSHAQSGVTAPALASVAIVPSQPVVAIGSSTQLKAIATFDDGSTKDVTTDFAWTSSDPRTVGASSSGVLTGLASGKATISGSYQSSQASVPTSSALGEIQWSGPIVISQGGTYSGNWQSTDSKTPAVTVATRDPVTIENSHIQGAGSLIQASIAGSSLTVRNSLGMVLNPDMQGQPNGNFLEVSSPTWLDVENNYVENARGGVIVHGYSGNRDREHTIVIRSNRARNMNGLLSDGKGGYLPGEGASRTLAHFIQFDSVQSVPGIDVGWNEVINYPGHSLVEDNIDVYRSSGTANLPLEIHDTYIQGAYPYRAAQDAFDGCGIKTDAKTGDTAQDVPAFNSIHDNQVVGTVGYGIEFAAGHDNIAYNNRVVSSGLLADGSRIAAQGVGLVDGDATGIAVANGSMYNNIMHDNLVGWACWKSSCAQDGYRNDQSFPASPGDYSTNSLVPAGQITFDMENNEYQVWLNKLSAAGITVGPSF